MAKKWQNQIEKLASFRSKSFLEERKLKKIIKISFKIRQNWSKTCKIPSRILKMGQNASVYKNVPFVGNQLNLTYMSEARSVTSVRKKKYPFIREAERARKSAYPLTNAGWPSQPASITFTSSTWRNRKPNSNVWEQQNGALEILFFPRIVARFSFAVTMERSELGIFLHSESC